MELTKALQHGERIGLDELEIFVHRRDTIDAEGELGEVSKTNKRKETAIFVRGLVNNSIGFGFTNDPNFLEKTIKKTYETAKANRKDKNWHGLPEPGKYADIEEYDPAISGMPAEEVIDTCQQIIELTPKGVIPSFCSTQREVDEKHCANTNGIDISEKGTWTAGYAYLTGKTEEGVTPGCLGIEITRKKDLNIEKIVKTASRDVKILKNRKKAKPGLNDVIMHPFALDDLLNSTLFTSVLGENVVRGKSSLKDRIGSRIASEKLTITDDPLYDNGICTTKFDSEGVPTRKTILIEDGTLKNFLWNDYWAKMAGTKSTGNGSRDSTRGTVGTSPTNMIVSEGNGGVFDIDRGYYVKGFQGAHSSNPESGEFSVVCNPAFTVEDGEITGGCVLMISGTVYDLLKKIDAIGKKKITGSSLMSPLIRFKDVKTAVK
ncbi:MAG: TldD/PmbA family protein [Euryarchaeota archaeon]|nr:TldD/PmbA family protein [Euryarchaeota archaeon]